MSRLILLLTVFASSVSTAYATCDWDVLWKAISIRESQCNDDAVNPHSTAEGRFQLLNIAVDEANRISGSQAFTYADKKCPRKAMEIINIIQSKYNPTKDIDTAIRLHRIGFSKKKEDIEVLGAYSRDVKSIMSAIKNDQSN